MGDTLGHNSHTLSIFAYHNDLTDEMREAGVVGETGSGIDAPSAMREAGKMQFKSQ